MVAVTEPAVQLFCYFPPLKQKSAALPKCLTLTPPPDCQWQVCLPPRCFPRRMEIWCVMPALTPLEETARVTAAGRSSATTATTIWSVSFIRRNSQTTHFTKKHV